MRRWSVVSGLSVLYIAAMAITFTEFGHAAARRNSVRASSSASADAPLNGLKPVSAFNHIRNKTERSAALFAEAAKVIESPRCLNCHPSGERPSQHEAMTPHEPLVVRGLDGLGAEGLRCANCHGEANFDTAHVPGNPQWRLAPESMAWQGKSVAEICEQLKDPARNGGRSAEQLVDHSAHDPLVGWGWAPGEGRAPAPGTQERFGALVAAWLKTGGHCPSKRAGL